MDELTSIINKLKESGEMSFYEGVSEEQIDNLVHNFINELPRVWQQKFCDPLVV